MVTALDEVTDMLLFIFCVISAIVFYANKYYVFSILFVILTIGWFFVTMVKVVKLWIDENE